MMKTDKMKNMRREISSLHAKIKTLTREKKSVDDALAPMKRELSKLKEKVKKLERENRELMVK